MKSWTRLSDFTFTHWRRKWQRTPVFLPGESLGLRSPVGCRLWGRTELDTTEATQQQQGKESTAGNPNQAAERQGCSGEEDQEGLSTFFFFKDFQQQKKINE